MKSQADNTPFTVAYLWTEESYIVHRGGLLIGQPTWFSKKENAQKHADFLNTTHGFEIFFTKGLLDLGRY